MPDDISIQIKDFQQPDVMSAASATDVQSEGDLQNLDPVTATIIFGGALALGKFVIHLVNVIRGGTVIDLTKTPIDIHRDHDLNYLFFMIVAKDGSIKVEAKDEPKEGLERMVESILSLGTNATVELAKAAIKDTTSDNTTVEDSAA